MKATERLIARYQLPIFFLLSYILSWWSAPFTNGQIIPHGPALAAIIVLAITAGRQGLGDWWRRVTHWRVAWYWYAAGPAIILAYQGIAFLINLLLGSAVSTPPALPATGILLELLLLGGLWEEPGWTGYALPKLQERFAHRPNGAQIAILAAGLFRAIWHLPLYLYGHIQWFDVFIFTFGFQIIIAWLYNRSGGSVPVAILFHFASNYLGATFSPVFAGAERTMYYALFMGMAVLVALALLKFAGPARPAVIDPARSSP